MRSGWRGLDARLCCPLSSCARRGWLSAAELSPAAPRVRVVISAAVAAAGGRVGGGVLGWSFASILALSPQLPLELFLHFTRPVQSFHPECCEDRPRHGAGG